MALVTGKTQRLRIAAAHVGLWALMAVTLFPLLAVVSISLRPGNFATGSLIPTELSLEHWKLALGMSYQGADGVLVTPPFPVLLWLWNSIKVATISALLIVGISTTAAYGFARLKFRFKGPILNSMLLLQMFPVAVALVAIYAIFEAIGQYVPWLGIETHAGLIVAYLGGVATHVWTIKGYFETIPAEIEECAKVDGATSWQAFYRAGSFRGSRQEASRDEENGMCGGKVLRPALADHGGNGGTRTGGAARGCQGRGRSGKPL